MKIAEGMNVKLGIFDIETLKGMVDIGIYDPDADTWVEFEISEYKNDLYSFVKFYTSGKEYDYWVSFNGISFDHQVLQYIVNEYENWYELGGLEIAGLVHEFVQDLIDNQRYEIPLPFKESVFPVKPIDLFKIHHFDNEARRTSLKWCEFMMNMDVEEMPIHHTQEKLSLEDIKIIKDYRRHDILATYNLLKVTLGDVDIPELNDYKGKNKIQDRFDVMEVAGLPCLNWSDVKIGEEWNKTDYKKAENIKDDSQLFTKKIKHPFGQKFKNFFPKTMHFRTDALKKFVEELGNEYVKNIKQEFSITIGKTTYTIAKGGLHSTEKNRAIVPSKGFRYTDIDVGSQYPNSIVKLKVFAPHLKETILDQFKGKIKRRFKHKDLAKKYESQGDKENARKNMSVQEMLKLCLNGGYYGKLGQPGSFLEYPEGLLRVCMGNQIEILMLVEMMESAGLSVMSGNTDGITVYYADNQEDTFLKICKEWEEAVGNHEMGKLEHTEFLAMYQDSINSYIAKKIDLKTKKESVKKKGKFLTQFELNKNKSKRIIAMALEEYFMNGKNPIDFIRNHENIYDFCIAKKAFGNLHYEEILDKDNTKIHKKLIRYYVCNSGNVFMKRGINNEGDPMNNHCEATDKDFPWMGQPKLKYFNRFFEGPYDINYDYYILEVLKRIDKIQKTNMAKTFADTFKTKQTTLF